MPSRSDPSRHNHPGGMLRQMLGEKRWTYDDLASITGRSRQTIGNIVTGRSRLSPDMAVTLSAAFGNDASDWLRWDAEHQLTLVDADTGAIERRARLHDMAPIREMQRRGWIAETDDLATLEQSLNAFYSGSLLDGIRFPVAARRSTPLNEMNSAEKAWCFRARQLAAMLPVPRFSKSSIPTIETKLRRLAAYPKGVQKLGRTLAEFGVRLVLVELIPGAKIDGATFWINRNPVIALSVRWDRIDAFWFTCMHEFAHIKHGHVYSVDVNLLVESDQGLVNTGPSDDKAELVANSDAADILVPEAELTSFIRRLSPLYSSSRIVQFAHRMRIHPGIVVGQLQHRRELGYSAHRAFLVRIREFVAGTALTDGWGHVVPATT